MYQRARSGGRFVWCGFDPGTDAPENEKKPLILFPVALHSPPATFHPHTHARFHRRRTFLHTDALSHLRRSGV